MEAQMQSIENLKPWKFAHRGIFGVNLSPGVYPVKPDNDSVDLCFGGMGDNATSVSNTCAELALQLGVGKLKAAKLKASSKPAGKAKPPASSRPARASKKKTSKKRVKKKSS